MVDFETAIFAQKYHIKFGMDLFYKKYEGEGKPLFIFHGLFGMLDNWHNVAKKLAQHYTVYSVDLRNHGQSPHSYKMNYELMADDIAQLLLKLKLEKAYIVGHSMGGKAVMAFALKYPNMVDKLVVADIGIKGYERGHDDIFDAIIPLKLNEFETRSAIDKHLQPMLPNYGVRQFILKNLGRNVAGGFTWKMNLEAIYKNYEAITAGIKSDTTFNGETLFIRGGKSGYIKNEDWAAIEKLFTTAKLETIEGAGHWVHAEKPKEVVKLVVNFFN